MLAEKLIILGVVNRKKISADLTNIRAYGTMCRLSVVCNEMYCG